MSRWEQQARIQLLSVKQTLPKQNVDRDVSALQLSSVDTTSTLHSNSEYRVQTLSRTVVHDSQDVNATLPVILGMSGQAEDSSLGENR